MKKLVLPIITLIVGFVAGYLISKQNEQSNFASEKTAFINANKWVLLPGTPSPNTQITNQDTIIAMKTLFRSESNGLFLGSDGTTSLKGYHIERSDLDALLNKKKIDGTNAFSYIGFYFGKAPGHLKDPKRIYTLMFMGANKDAKTNDYVDDDSNVYDQVDICPKKCGSF